MSYFRIRYTATVYTREDVTDEEQLENDIEMSFDEVLYNIFGGDTYNANCEVERRVSE